MNLNKEFSNPKKKQENTVRQSLVEKLPQPRVVENRKVKALHYLKEARAKAKEKEMIVSQTPPPLSGGKGGESKKGNSKTKACFNSR